MLSKKIARLFSEGIKLVEMKKQAQINKVANKDKIMDQIEFYRKENVTKNGSIVKMVV